MTLIPNPITGRHVLVGLLIFFGVMLSADFALIYFSLKTHPGVTSENAYRDGLDYNATIAEAERQASLGWQLTVEHTRLDDGAVRFQIDLQDASQQPIKNGTVDGKLIRPVTRGLDRPLTFIEAEAGRYMAVSEVPLPGNWRLEVRAQSPAGTLRRIVELDIR